MKIHHHLIVIITALTLTACGPVHAGWLSNNDEPNRLAETESQLQSQRSTTGQWQLVAGIFGVGCVLLFVIGTALGSKTRHATRS